MTGYSRRAGLLGLLVAGMLLVACGTSPTSRAPVEERRTAVSRPVMDPNTVAVKQPPGFENAGKVGYYTVKPGETLIRIGLETGQNWKDIARWNNLEQPNQIEVGQVLRVTPPATAVAATTESNGVVTRPISSASIASGQVQPGQTSSAAAKPSAAAAAAAEPAAAAESGLSWIWPVPGPVLAGFDELKNKGLDLGGAAGEPVLAAAEGRVVYVGAGLRGYGNLIILKHNNTYLTAYAHNKTLLVKEDQAVRKGQKIAEMGNSDADRVKLHFEVRRQGKPVDPLKYLPPR
ncbi:peptidoglycan DD-metalloendopeptidase family protein [Curvibacter sp. PAE-UM]|uniref:peptidoglycan DD-metalloendopeptidase family protein n=1 Tax=Curvibacter sp. PAE-UM TaxID=1714344 RepID=UPI00070F298E|nr:peptidoglycan DD-metalloendopeptidase family protein [Curvibacter sp. PAE-UM]KRI01020.1 peptidase [Curvibacter sp. PAE-UM]